MRPLVVGLVVAGGCLLAGCGSGGSAGWLPNPVARAVPVAATTGSLAMDAGNHNFLGIGVGGMVGTSDTDATGPYAHLTYNREFNRWIALEFEIGFGQANEGADSELLAGVGMVAIQVGNEFKSGRGRWYVVGGGGYVINDFRLSSRDVPTLAINYPGATDLDLDDGSAWMLGGGFEVFQAIRQRLNMAIEARHIWHEADASLVGTTLTPTFDLDRWIFRVAVTYPF